MSKHLGTLYGAYRLKEPGAFPAPCKADPERTLELGPTMLFTRMAGEPAPEGYHAYVKQTGLCVVGILLPDDAVEWHEGPFDLVLM